MPSLGGFGMMSLAMGTLWIVMGVIALLGGAVVRKKRSWGFGMTGAILALLFVPSLGVRAIVFLSLAKGEFE